MAPGVPAVFVKPCNKRQFSSHASLVPATTSGVAPGSAVVIFKTTLRYLRITQRAHASALRHVACVADSHWQPSEMHRHTTAMSYSRE